jgi:hypothetical protein
MKKNIFKGTVIVFFIFTLFAFVTGCTTITGSSSSGPALSTQQGSVAMAKILKFEDVPVPAGFRLLDNESFIFQNDQMRVGLLKYSGMPDANKVVEFYKEQMPMYTWDLINVIEYGQKVMNFERLEQTCIITIQPKTTRTVITIAVAPKSNSAITEEKVRKYKELKFQKNT